MTNPTRNLTTRAALTATAAHNARWFASILAGTTVLASSAFATDWVGDTSAAWNDNANWAGDAGNTGNATVNTNPATNPPFRATISADATQPVVDIFVGAGAATNGRLEHTAGTAGTGTNNWMFVGVSGGTGVYNLADTAASGGTFTGFGLGSGSMNVGGSAVASGRLYVGGRDNGGLGTGTVNVNTSGTLKIGNDLVIGASGGTGTVNLDAGTVTTNGWNFVGTAAGAIGGTGNLRVSGGTLTNGTTNAGGCRTYIGLGNSTGSMEISGGTYNNIQGGVNTQFIIGTGNLSNATTPTLTMTGGTINATRVFTIGGTEAFGGDVGSVGSGKGSATLNGASALLNVTGEFWVGHGAGSTGSFTLTSGNLQVNNWIAVGRGGSTGTFTQTGGVVTKTGSGNVSIGNGGAGLVPASLTVSGGLFDAQTGNILVGEGGAGSSFLNISGTGHVKAPQVLVAPGGTVISELNLDGGTLTTGIINGAGGGTSNVDFNGTQIVATAIQPTFIANFDSIDLEAGGLKVDSNGFAVGSAQNLAGPGGVIKSGLGTLTLTGTNSYSGASTVSGGKLAVTTNSTGGGSYTVANDASLGLTVLSLDAQMTTSSATFGAGGTSSLDINHSAILGNPSSAPLNVTGTLAINGTVAINLSNALPSTGTFPLVQYGTKSGGNFVLGTLPNGVQATLEHDTVNKVYYLNITSVSVPYWDATNDPFWTTNSSPTNWINLINSSQVPFVDGNPVLFDDFVSGPTQGEVLLNQTVRPSGVTYDNDSKPYSLSGSGKISDAFSGSTPLLKQGTGTATINTNNDFTGKVTIEEGTLSVPTLTNGGVAGPLGAATSSAANLVLAGGRLEYTGGAVTINRGFSTFAANNTINSTLSLAADLTTSGQVTSVFGKLTKDGLGTLTLTNPGSNLLANGDNGLPGALRVDQGSLVLSGGGTQTNTVNGEVWIGSTLTSGATLVLNNTTFTSNTWMSVGRGNGTTGLTSSVTATGSTITTGNLSLGFSNNTVGHLATSALTLNSSSFTTGASHIGESGGSTATVTLNGSTLTAGQMNVGRFNASNGTVTLNGASTASSTELNVGQEGGAVGAMVLNDTSVFNTGNRVLIGNLAGSTGSLTIAGNAVFNRTGGYTSIGAGGTGTLTVKNSGTLNNTTSDFNVGDVGTAQGTLNLQDTGTINAGVSYFGKAVDTKATLNLSGGTFVGGISYFGLNGDATVTLSGSSSFTGTAGYFAQQATAAVVVNQTGGTFNIGANNEVFYGERGTLEWNLSAGTVNTSGWSVIGRRPGSTGTVNVSGGTFAHTMPERSIIVGEEGTGVLTVSGTGAVTSDGNNGIMVANSAASGVGTVNLDGGSITVKSIHEGAGGISALNFNGGLLVAGAAATPAFVDNLDTVTVKAGGAKIDSNGQTVAINTALLDGGTGGGLVKSGAGTLELNGANTYTGITTVSAGTLAMGNPVFANSSTVVIEEGAVLHLPHGQTDVVGGLTIDEVMLPNGVYSSTTHPTFITGSGQIQVGAASPAYTAWINIYFPGEDDEAIIGLGADPDLDGSPNSLEYALGGTPNSGIDGPKVHVIAADGSVDGDSDRELLLTIAVLDGPPEPDFSADPSPTASVDGFTYVIQGSTDLATFTSPVTEVDVVAPQDLPTPPTGYVYRTFSLDGSNDLPTKGFLRVKVTP